jgi:hypothetical protein
MYYCEWLGNSEKFLCNKIRLTAPVLSVRGLLPPHIVQHCPRVPFPCHLATGTLYDFRRNATGKSISELQRVRGEIDVEECSTHLGDIRRASTAQLWSGGLM